ncbi:MAG: class I SAM-dependent methyltransferase [Acidimicrobiales bacterium]
MAFEELKARQSVSWGTDSYERISRTVADAHRALVSQLAPREGERVLDIGTGTGAVARLAARERAVVTGLDLSPQLVGSARLLAAAEGIPVSFDVGDAERMPYADESFDIVASAFGCMFAPDHRAVAAELARVCRPGGRLGLLTWDSHGGVAEFFGLMAPFQPPAPPGVGNPLDWGREGYIADLLAHTFDLRFRHGSSPLRAESPEAVWELFSTAFGPTRWLAESLEPTRRDELRRAFIAYYGQHQVDGRIRAPREWLLVWGLRSG